MATNTIDISSSNNEPLSIALADDHVHYPPVVKDLFIGLSLDLEKNRWTAKYS